MICEKYVNYTMTKQQKVFTIFTKRENINIYKFEWIYLKNNWQALGF